MSNARVSNVAICVIECFVFSCWPKSRDHSVFQSQPSLVLLVRDIVVMVIIVRYVLFARSCPSNLCRRRGLTVELAKYSGGFGVLVVGGGSQLEGPSGAVTGPFASDDSGVIVLTKTSLNLLAASSLTK
jgi:hypothetical protein